MAYCPDCESANRKGIRRYRCLVYVAAVEDAFGASVDYAQLVKLFQGDVEPGPNATRQVAFLAIMKSAITGNNGGGLDQHKLRGTPELDGQDGGQAVCPACGCLFEEGRKPQSRLQPALCLLQLSAGRISV